MIRDQYISSVVKSVIVSEKSAGLRDNGSTIVLSVLRDAPKKAIKEAVEKLFGFKVESVNTINYAGKFNRSRNSARQDWKKAYVTLEKGQNLEQFDGAAE